MFSGSWTVEACEAVGARDDDLDALATLSSLVAQSLIHSEPPDAGGELRFRMLDTIRSYAGERLVECGEDDATLARMASYLVDVVRAVSDDLLGPGHRAAEERLDRDRDEIQSSITWALRNDEAATVGRLLGPLFTYWWSRGRLAMASAVAEEAAALPSAALVESSEAALLRGVQGMAMGGRDLGRGGRRSLRDVPLAARRGLLTLAPHLRPGSCRGAGGPDRWTSRWAAGW